MDHRITHPFESTRCSRFYPAGTLRDTESLLTPAGDEQTILSLSSGRPEQGDRGKPEIWQSTTGHTRRCSTSIHIARYSDGLSS